MKDEMGQSILIENWWQKKEPYNLRTVRHTLALLRLAKRCLGSSETYIKRFNVIAGFKEVNALRSLLWQIFETNYYKETLQEIKNYCHEPNKLFDYEKVFNQAGELFSEGKTKKALQVIYSLRPEIDALIEVCETILEKDTTKSTRGQEEKEVQNIWLQPQK